MYYPRIISIDMYAAAWLWTNEQPYQQYPILDKKKDSVLHVSRSETIREKKNLVRANYLFGIQMG